jgi:choline dehydrogenase-like flavoprotein
VSEYNREEVQLRRALRGVAVVGALLFLAMLVGAILGLGIAVFQPSFLANAAVGLGLIALLAWFASGDVRRFRFLVRVLIGGLLFGALALVILAISPGATNDQSSLLTGAIVFGLVGLALGWLLRRTPVIPGVLPWMTDKPLTLPEQIGRVVFAALGVAWLAATVGLLLLALVGGVSQPLVVGGAVIGTALLGTLAALVARNVRVYAVMVTLLVLGHLLSLVAVVVAMIRLAPESNVAIAVGGATLSTSQVLTGWLVVDLISIVVLSGLLLVMSRARLDYLGFLGPLEFRIVEGLADSIVNDVAEPLPQIPAHEVALRLDRYLDSFPSARLRLTRLALVLLEVAPLTWLWPPLSFLSPQLRREFIDRLYKRDVSDRRARHPVLTLMQAAMRLGMQGVYVGYYSDDRVQKEIGFKPFSKRYADFAQIKPIRKYPPLRVITPEDLRRQGTDVITSADVVIIGSGAGGAILAEQLANRGRDVLILERGLYVDPDDFNEDEISMTGRLYSDGALQTAQSYRFQIIQGSCVGGSTVVNNAVCFDTPDHILKTWNDPQGANAEIDVDSFKQALLDVRDRLAIKNVKHTTKTRPVEEMLNPSYRKIAAGLAEVGMKDGDVFDVVEANIVDCLGCGYCNAGCKYGRKISMLDEVLPKAQRDRGADRFRIISEAEAVKLNGNGRQIKEIVVQLRDGRQLLIRNPKTVIVSAGTIASSWLLMRSGIGKGELPVGQHISFNLGSAMYGYWPPENGHRLNSYDGLQIAHYLKVKEHPGFVVETWYNPPVAQAQAMPGWLDRHQQNMRRYSDLGAMGILVGSDATARVQPAFALGGAPDIVYNPTERDLKTLVDGLVLTGEVMFAGGAKEVMASTISYKDEAVFKRPEDLQRLRKLVQDDRDLVLGTGHPQGGNAISKTRGQDRGVIDPTFKVHGYDNLYVCDASVFPGATTVNPQLTVMAMAHYAAPRIHGK